MYSEFRPLKFSLDHLYMDPHTKITTFKYFNFQI